MYNVGQIVYIYKVSSESLFPCVIAEQVVKKTLSGEQINYTVLLPDEEETLVELSKLNAKCFTNIEEFNNYYISEANKRVNSAVLKCSQIEEARFKKFQNKTPEIKGNNTESVESDLTSKISVSDENNVKINVDLSRLKEVGL